MLGAIIGDIAGSRFERKNHRSKLFTLLTEDCYVTDDSLMTLAICQALLHCKTDQSDLSVLAVKYMQEMGRAHPYAGYGKGFRNWIHSDNPQPYNSIGNGAAMRVSGCGIVARSLEEAKFLSRSVTEVTHNHPESIKGAEATAVAVFLANNGSTIAQIQEHINNNYYPMDFTLDSIRDTYQFSSTCQGTVPQALTAFFESTDFEDTIRNAISIGGDSDTIAAIAGGIAGVYYGIPAHIAEQGLCFLEEDLQDILWEFESSYPPKAGEGK